MAKRPMVLIDEELCTGCGDCVPSCAEGAIQIIDGKARLLADKLCDGLGACLGDCPVGALTVEEREADGFDEAAVKVHLATQAVAAAATPMPTPVAAAAPAPAAGCSTSPAPGMGGGCPGSRMMQFDATAETDAGGGNGGVQASALRQWPVQLHLVAPTAPYFEGADVLLAADCCAFAMGDFHANHLKGRSLAIACPKLDQGQEVYLDKLVAMIDQAGINTLTVMIMQVPCCGGLAHLASSAVAKATRKVPVKRVVVGLQGEILSEDWV